MRKAIVSTVSQTNRSVNKAYNTLIMSATSASNRYVSSTHKKEREKQQARPDINPETDADRWSDPADPKFVEDEMSTPNQVKRDRELIDDKVPSAFQKENLNDAWKGYKKTEELEEEIDKKGVQNR